MRLISLVALVFLVLFAPAITAQSSQGSFGGDASITFKGAYLEKYLFRGHLFHDDVTYQGEVGLGISSWSYHMLYSEPADETGFFKSEYQHSIGYTTVTPGGVVTTGYNFYDYSGLQPDTQELFIRYSTPSQWNPTYGLTYDFDTYKGYYFDFNISRNLPLTRRSQMLFSLGAGLSYQLDEERDELDQVTEPGFFGKDGLNHYAVKALYVWQLRHWVKLDAGATYFRAEDDFLYKNQGFDRDQTVWHAALTLNFP